MAFYDRARAAHGRLMASYGHGSVTLTKTETVPGPNPWDPPTTVETDETLDAIVSGVTEEFVNGSGSIVATDLSVQCGVPTDMPNAGDQVKVDGVARAVLAVHPLPGAGDPVAVRIICR
ncbi:hypothetical protein [Salipiger mangrovisoli]|uniref:Uncharacterized protein n=1 Tax=Salipiger mangrovisoli TaxID=2865933 RepID=A0ABR9WZ76_9RHOB|nr:hypothetical protein [Salipiger mangrovisoli]MBE9636545.1 hypothetical protein [Salipiger mangrovisoli]